MGVIALYLLTDIYLFYVFAYWGEILFISRLVRHQQWVYVAFYITCLFPATNLVKVVFIIISGSFHSFCRFITTIMDNIVLNLADKKQTYNQLNILSKVLNFCSSPKEPNCGDLRFDSDSLHMRLKLHSHFHNEEEPPPQLIMTTTHEFKHCFSN